MTVLPVRPSQPPSDILRRQKTGVVGHQLFKINRSEVLNSEKGPYGYNVDKFDLLKYLKRYPRNYTRSDAVNTDVFSIYPMEAINLSDPESKMQPISSSMIMQRVARLRDINDDLMYNVTYSTNNDHITVGRQSTAILRNTKLSAESIAKIIIKHGQSIGLTGVDKKKIGELEKLDIIYGHSGYEYKKGSWKRRLSYQKRQKKIAEKRGESKVDGGKFSYYYLTGLANDLRLNLISHLDNDLNGYITGIGGSTVGSSIRQIHMYFRALKNVKRANYSRLRSWNVFLKNFKDCHVAEHIGVERTNAKNEFNKLKDTLIERHFLTEYNLNAEVKKEKARRSKEKAGAARKPDAGPKDGKAKVKTRTVSKRAVKAVKK